MAASATDRLRSVAQFLGAVGEQMPAAVLPVLLSATPAAPLAVGLAEAAASAAGGAGRAAATTRLRRRVGGGVAPLLPLATSGLLASILGVVTASWQAVVVRGASAGVGDLGYPAHTGRRPGAAAIGTVVAPLLAAGVILVVGIRATMIAAVIPAIAAMVLVLVAGVGGPPEDVPEAGARGLHRILTTPIRVVRQRPHVAAAILAFEFGNVAVNVLMLRALIVFSPGRGLVVAGALALLLAGLHGACAVVASAVVGRVSSDAARAGALGIGAVLFLLAYLGIGLSTNAAVLVAAFAAAGTALGGVRRGQREMVTAIVDRADRQEIFGVLSQVQAVGSMLASAITGFLWAVVSLRAALVYLSVWLVLAAVAIALGLRGSKFSTSAS